jgi:hypothetical protein
VPPKPLPIPTETRNYFPCHRGPLLDFRGWQFRLARDQEQWWEQMCPVCDQHYRFIRTEAGFGYIPVSRYTDPEQGDRSLPVDPWLMAVRIAHERDAA